MEFIRVLFRISGDARPGAWAYWRPFSRPCKGIQMFKVNEYFDGTVKSIAFDMTEGPATIGVMAPGESEFGTAQLEVMHVVAGSQSEARRVEKECVSAFTTRWSKY